MRFELRFSALSDVGRVRKDNQDSGYAGPHLLVVADGVGGAARGDVASTATVQQMRAIDAVPEDDAPDGVDILLGGIAMAHDRISDLVADNPEFDGTSTTVVAGLIIDDELSLAHVGDSRAYLLRQGDLTALTRDHSFVQSLVDEGRITEEEARTHPNRNLILRAVDGVHPPNADTSTHPLELGDRLLFCSDGCCGVLTDEEIAELLGSGDIDGVTQKLVTAALDAGSTDNVTVVVAEIVEAAALTDGVGEALPILVGAASHPIRPPSRPSRLRRRTSEPPPDPELARYAPRPPRRRRALRILIALLVFLAIIVGGLYGAYRWSQSEYFVGVDANGYVTAYRGMPGSVFGYQLHTAIWHSQLNVDVLGEQDRETLQDTPSASSAAQARKNIVDMFHRNCGTKPSVPAPTAPTTPSPHTCPSAP